MHVLVVEDNYVNQKLASKCLSRWNCTETKAWNGKQALDYLANHQNPRPNIILLDVSMPVMSGIEALNHIRTQQPFIDDPILQNTPVIMMTAHAMPGYRKLWLERGASDILPKPIRLAQLRRLLSIWSPRNEMVPVRPGGTGFMRRPVWGPMPLRAHRGPRSLL